MDTAPSVLKPEIAWAAAWVYNVPDPFILTHTVSRDKARGMYVLGAAWKKPGESEAQGWKRAYRKGARMIRVSVAPLVERSPSISQSNGEDV